tara:strand:- start:1475 stop:2014 length:540 start_codon:yes stop_codon:yes gene_type:complete
MSNDLPRGIRRIKTPKKMYDNNWIQRIFNFELESLDKGRITKSDIGLGTGANAICSACWQTYTEKYKSGDKEMSDTPFLSDYNICNKCRTPAQGKPRRGGNIGVTETKPELQEDRYGDATGDVLGNMFWKGDGFALLNESKRCINCDRTLAFDTDPMAFQSKSDEQYCSTDCYYEDVGT